MMKTGVRLMLMMAMAVTLIQAQQPQPQTAATAPQVARTNMVERVDAPTDSDIYCAGFVTPQGMTRNSYVAGGWETPSQSLFADRDYIYLTGGTYNVGGKYSIYRLVKEFDFNIYEPYPGQKKDAKALGTMVAEVGRVSIVKVERNIGVAHVDFSCGPINVGDFTAPFEERPRPQFRRVVPFDRFASPNGLLVGRIIAQKENNMIAGSKDKVYLNVGSNQGVKVGDYFRATRTYESLTWDPNEKVLFKARDIDPTFKDQAKFGPERMKELPRRSIGQMIVLSVTPTTTTAMVTDSLEQVQVGDGVELMEELPPLPPPAPVAMNPPLINCTASPATVRAGESSTIRCEATSPDGRPVTITFSTDRGAITPRETSATLDTTNVAPGPAMVLATAMDDRNMSASAATQVTVEAPPAPTAASNLGALNFKNNSAYTDNAAKAMLDDVALRMQREAGSQVVLIGHNATGEAARLSGARASNAKTYLVRDKGIDASLVQVRDGGPGSRTVEVWFVPAGAPMP